MQKMMVANRASETTSIDEATLILTILMPEFFVPRLG